MLTTLDRVAESEFAVTHEFLAMLLGSSRPSISVVIQDFETQGLLRNERGRVVVGDRDRLLSVACGCYEVIKENYSHVGQ